MKIVCKNKEEYEKLMKASKYLHDFVVWDEKDNPHSVLDTNNEIINFLCHIYLSEEDWPDKEEYIKIE